MSFKNCVNALSMVKHWKILFKLHQYVVQILIEKCMERLTLPMSASAMVTKHIKYPIRTSIFTVNLVLKLFPITVADTDIGSLKSIHTFLYKYLNHKLVKFWGKNVWSEILLNFLPNLFDP